VANAIVTKMNGASKQVRNQLATARGARDVVKTLCLNDKLSQIDVTTRAAESRLSNIQAAVANGNKESAHHEMNMLSALGQRSDQSTAEANQCVGEELAFVGATQVSTSVDGDIITVDEYVDVNTGVIVVVPVPPSAASPSK